MGQLYDSFAPALFVLNGISLALASTVVALLLTIAFFYYGLTNRVTFRIQGMIALLDITRHISIYYVRAPNNSLCMFFGFYAIFSDNLYVFLNVVVAMNAHLIGIRNVAPSKRLHIWLLFCAITVSFLLNIGAYAFDFVGENSFGQCFIKEGLDNRWIAEMILVYLPIVPGISYCAYISFLLFFKFSKKSSCEKIVVHSEIETPRMSYMKAIDFIRSLYLRVALLPFFCFMSMFFFVFLCIWTNLGGPGWDIFRILSVLGMRSAGTLNFIAFVCDPYFQIALKRIISSTSRNSCLSYDVESCRNSRINHGIPVYCNDDDEFEKIAAMKFDHDDLEILGQRKYVKFL